jgi:two-component sensor histidine kinase
MNNCLRNSFGKDFTGKICWKSLHNDQDGPCEFCTNNKLIDTMGNPSEPYVWEVYNTILEKWYELHDQAIPWLDGRFVRMEIAIDVTERKNTEDQIKASLREKETLLKEIHHRVKNNMTVISSLLNLQMTRLSDKEAKEALQDSQNRVQTMSMIHETLYRSDNLSAIDMKTYLSELGRIIFQSYNLSGKVTLKIEAEGILIGVKQASPVGLIVNELITNSLKYAFLDGREGEILLELKSNNENGVELTVSDNGVGIPEGFDLKTADSLGLKLVKMLVENQLDGSVDMESNNGTKFTIKFNIET